MIEEYKKKIDVIAMLISTTAIIGEKEIDALQDDEYKYQIKSLTFDFMEILTSIMKELKAKVVIHEGIEEKELPESYRDDPKILEMTIKKIDNMFDEHIKNMERKLKNDS
jgi:hypothetical protein